MNPPKAAPKKLVTKASIRKQSATGKQPRRQMTVALAEKRAFKLRDGHKIDIVAFLRTLR